MPGVIATAINDGSRVCMITLTDGNILKVSYKVLGGREFNDRSRHYNDALRCVRCDPVESWDIFIGL